MDGSSQSSHRKRNKLDGLRIRNDIRRLYVEGKQPQEICKILDITYENFRYYCSQIYKEDRKELQRARTDLLAHEIIIARNRLLGSIRRCEEITADPNVQPRDKIAAMQLAKETSMDIIRIILEGPQLTELTTQSEDDTPDNFPSDEFIKFAEATAHQQFQRTGEP
ncbi:MAG: hypothetical protein QXE84_02060 [Candidatus Nitrosotenuis sp.]|uniref:Uncharacterized protein n=1 Tax=Candidatus Nitrosotenuis uzonensis TaxID=1407055 RepID=A0A812F189_9ARCH|nr:hypothetical protein [Candidatus Nitrosotenuis uzonensis]CAE6500807.1 hypothetical protein NUZ5A_51067 [Candidatus Nitrosotenuis uzonensis]